MTTFGRGQKKASRTHPSSEQSPANLELLADQLAVRSRHIDQRSANINFHRIFSDYQAMCHRHQEYGTQAATLHQQALNARRHANELENQRFLTLTTNLRDINERLGALYRRCVPSADCYLAYASNPISLYEEGLTIRAQHGASAWRDAAQLSGGQQAACSLSLLLAVQESFPSPLYIMDEVDASLDTSTVARIGALLREKSLRYGTQFVLVSHRPEMQDCACRLVGVYQYQQKPTAISMSFAEGV